MSTTLARKTPKNARRQRRLLETAERLFVAYGFNGVSVEMIAKEAGMSKVTVYAYFHDKNDIFQQTAEFVGGRIEYAVALALASSGNPKEKIVSVLQAKDEMVFNIVRSSPHANEILAARDRLVREYFEGFNKRIEDTLRRLLKDLNEKKPLASPARLAKLLIQTSRGLTQGATSAEQLKRDINLVIGKLIT